MSSPDFGTSPPQYGRIARPRGFLVLNNEQNGSPMATHGHGTLTALIKSRSTSSLTNLHLRRASVLVGRETPDEEDHIARPVREEDLEDFSRNNERRMSVLEVLTGPQMRSQRLLGNSNPRYRWERYWKSDEELKAIKKKTLRQYYERVNSLVQQYIYIDRLLDSSLPHDLLNEYNDASANSGAIAVPPTILEEPRSRPDTADPSSLTITSGTGGTVTPPKKVNRTPRELYKVNGERTPLLSPADSEEDEEMNRKMSEIPGFEDDSVESGDRIVQVAIWINLAANIILLIGKILVIYLTSSLSVLASLVDAALDFLSTIIVGVTGWMISRQDKYQYPIGRRRLEPIGVLVFSVIMMTSFFQVALQCLSRLNSDDHSIIQLGIPALIIMASTVILKGLCWFWCRLVKNSSVQALAQDAMTDVIFNIFSIIFPLIGFYAKLWWLDGLGGLLLSLYVITNWAGTSAGHIRNLTGAAATPDERNVLLYLTMRFAKTILQIQGLQAYHAGDKLNVEVDIVLDENMSLRDSHDLGESLQYVLESVPTVDRAFVHSDYTGWNLPTHMQQQSE